MNKKLIKLTIRTGENKEALSWKAVSEGENLC